MKNLQQNLLIILALALCGLCAWQWYEQTIQRDEIGTLNGIVYQKNSDIQNDTNSIAVLNHQIEQMDARITEIKAAAATNEQLVVSQKRNNLNLTNEITQYKQAVDALQSKLKDAYADIGKQNETITNLVVQRDEFVQKYNGSVKDRNDIVAKYNDLVSQVQKQQGSQK